MKKGPLRAFCNIKKSFYTTGFCNDFTRQVLIFNRFTSRITVLPGKGRFPNASPPHNANYDASLTAFSRPLLGLIDYQLDEMGQMTVENDTACWYQYMEMTPQAEALYEFVTKTIKEELVQELSFLASYDNTRKAIQDIIDMPDRLIDLFIRMCLQNNGSLSAGKRSSHFDFLTGEELAAMEQAVKSGYAGYGN